MILILILCLFILILLCQYNRENFICKQGYIKKGNKCERVCTHCKTGYCQNGRCYEITN